MSELTTEQIDLQLYRNLFSAFHAACQANGHSVSGVQCCKMVERIKAFTGNDDVIDLGLDYHGVEKLGFSEPVEPGFFDQVNNKFMKVCGEQEKDLSEIQKQIMSEYMDENLTDSQKEEIGQKCSINLKGAA